MSASLDVVLVIAAQHLWQSAVLLLLAWAAFKLRPISADARSWIWLCVLVLAVVSPLAAFLPGADPVAEAAPAARAAVLLPGDIAPASSTTTDDVFLMQLLSALKPIAIATWLLGFAWQLWRLLGGWVEARRLQRTARAAPQLDHLLAQELPRNTVVKVSNRIASPMVVGLSRQCILVPETLAAELPQPVLLDILQHEIAHVRRRDMWISLAQRLFLAIYWWSPLLRLIGTRLDLAREMACDERAALRSGESKAYAASLLTSVDKVLSLGHQRHLLASGIFDTRKGLTHRIEGLLNMDPKTQRSGYRPALALGAVVLMASVALTLAVTPRVGYAALVAKTDDAQSQNGKAELLIEAAEAGRLEEVRRLVRSGVRVDARVDGTGTALIVAARAGNLQMVDALLRLGAPVDQYSLRDGNPLIVAAMKGHHDVVDRLIEAGANVNAVVTYDETPLINAAREGHLSIVTCLVDKGADVNLAVRADFGVRSPLNQAHGEDVRRYLISKGARPDGS